MALKHTALRIAAVEALRGRTIAGDTVIDTVGEIGDTPENAPRFSIAVGTLDAAAKLVKMAVTLTVWKRTVIEGEPDEAGNPLGYLAWVPAASDAPAQAALDLLEHQVLKAMQAGTPWGNVWAGIATDVEWASGRSLDPSVAQREMVLTITPAIDTAAGWSAFSAMVQGSNSIPGALKALVLDKLPDWAALGLDCGLAIDPAPPAETKPAKRVSAKKGKR